MLTIQRSGGVIMNRSGRMWNSGCTRTDPGTLTNMGRNSMTRLTTFKTLTIGAALAGSFGLAGAGLALAQDEPAVTPSHPGHIHAGTCGEDLDPNPIGPLNNIEPRMNEESDDENANTPQGVLTAPGVLASLSEEVEVPWEDMLATSHAINIHESDENIDVYIACGDIGGVVVEGELVVSLQPQNDSGYTGIAVLTEDGDGNVDVEVYLSEPAEASTQPEVTPTPEPTPEETVVITETEEVTAGEATARATEEAGD